ncbi:hypothetical protein DFH11DRAFT_904410 [Phellopilus nigrolimitatus]|nr:hypothetical protein DFH11DRAFT_904410 [Phellopilus nigrolimitatus]
MLFPHTFSLLAALSVLLGAAAAPSAPPAKRYPPQGTISDPANGTTIMPGAAFAFLYNPRADYCLSSYNFTVWLLTAPPQGMLAGTQTGHYFGRFAYSTYTNQDPPNPAPSELTMPDFAKSPGGFGAGASASAKTMYLSVVEEWSSCDPTVGNNLSMAANNIVYNDTST